MARRFALLGKDGHLAGFYSDAIGEKPPAGAFEITEDVWLDWLRNPATRVWRNGKLATVNVPDEPEWWEVTKLVLVERLTAAGLLRLSRAALKIGLPDAELSDAELALRERWEAAVAIRSDDAQARQLISAIGGDPDAILARTGEAP